MENMMFRKQIFFNSDEDNADIEVTQESNAFIIWLNDAYHGRFILDYHVWDRDAMIEKAVDLSRKPIETLLNSEIFVKKGKAWAEVKR